VSWVVVPDRLAATTSVRKQFTTAGQVTRSKKLEGAWGDDKGVYFTANYAHYADIPALSVPHDGQLWYLDHDRQTLTLQAYFPYVRELHAPSPAGAWTLWTLEQQRSLPDIFDGPDNVHVSPWGGLVVAEDGDGPQRPLHLDGGRRRPTPGAQRHPLPGHRELRDDRTDVLPGPLGALRERSGARAHLRYPR
jgi:hypothetical protein